MKKLLLSGLLAVILLSAISGSIAYFTDSISTSNTIASGNLEIALHEYKRIKNTDGSYSTQLQKYDDGQDDLMIYPSVGDFSSAARETVSLSYPKEDGTAVTFSDVNMYVSGIGNFVDKIAAAENIGTLPLYTRIYIAVPTLEGTPLLHLDTNRDAKWEWTVISDTIDDRPHDIYIATLRSPLAPGEFTPPSLLGFYLDSSMTNKHSELLALDDKGTMNILVAARATQANVFESGPEEAFLETFKAQTHPWAPNQ